MIINRAVDDSGGVKSKFDNWIKVLIWLIRLVLSSRWNDDCFKLIAVLIWFMQSPLGKLFRLSRSWKVCDLRSGGVFRRDGCLKQVVGVIPIELSRVCTLVIGLPFACV